MENQNQIESRTSRGMHHKPNQYRISRCVTGSFKVKFDGVTEEEVFDAMINHFRDHFGKQFKLEVSGRHRSIKEEHIF
jgi:hypothetical protein